MYRRLPVALVTAATAFSLVACGSDSPSGDAAESTPQTFAPSTPESSSEAVSSPASSSSAAAGAAKPVAVNKTITDPAFGNKVVVTSYVDGFEPSAASKAKYSTLEDDKVVLVQVTATAGTKYSASLDDGDFRLTGTSNDIDETSSSLLDDDVTAAGYKPLERVRPGQTGTGWVVFTVDSDLSKLVFRYQRLAYKTTDGANITRQAFDVPLN